MNRLRFDRAFMILFLIANLPICPGHHRLYGRRRRLRLCLRLRLCRRRLLSLRLRPTGTTATAGRFGRWPASSV